MYIVGMKKNIEIPQNFKNKLPYYQTTLLIFPIFDFMG